MSPLLRRSPLVVMDSAPLNLELTMKPPTAFVLFFVFLVVGCVVQYPLESLLAIVGLSTALVGAIAFLVRLGNEVALSRRLDGLGVVSRGTVKRLSRGQLVAAGGSRQVTRLHPRARI